MFIKLFNIIVLFLLVIIQSPLYSKNNNKNGFYYEELSNYFSAQVSYVNQNNKDALKFFRLSRSLINKHDPFLKSYVFSLISEGQVKKAIKHIKFSSKRKNSDFFEAYMLLIVESLKKNNLNKAEKYLKNLSQFKKNGTLELIIYETLRDYSFLFKNKTIYPEKSNFGNLSLINRAFQSCYLKDKNTIYKELLVTPNSPLVNRNRTYLRRQSSNSLTLMAVARENEPIHNRLGNIIFRVGDVLLIQGNAEILSHNISSLNLLPLAERLAITIAADDLKSPADKQEPFNCVVPLIRAVFPFSRIELPILFNSPT